MYLDICTGKSNVDEHHFFCGVIRKLFLYFSGWDQSLFFFGKII